MAKTVVQVKGLRELGMAMKKLEEDVKLRICRAATQAGAKVIKDLAIAKAPVAPAPYVVVDEGSDKRTGIAKAKGKKKQADKIIVQPRNIGRNIVTKRVSKSRFTAQTVIVVRGKRKHGFANRIAVLKEFGTVKMAPEPFMRPAFDQGKQPAVDKVKETLARRIDRAVKQHGKKGK